MHRFFVTTVVVASGFLAQQASAEVCQYRLSHLIGNAGAATSIGSVSAVSAGGMAFNATGFYIIIHSTSGLAMIGSTLPGASAAGTVGIIAGTSGILGTAAAIISAPATILAAGATVIGTGALEIGCYLLDDRITDYDTVLGVLRLVAQNMPPERFRLHEVEYGPIHPYISIDLGEPEMRQFEVRNLYIVNGQLLNRDWGPNTAIGDIALILEQIQSDAAHPGSESAAVQ